MFNRLHKERSTSGFTLIEMLVVVIIIGVLFSIAAPSWLSLTYRQRVNKANDQLLQAIRTTQNEAKRQRREYEIAFNTAADPPQVAIRPRGATGGTIQVLGDGEISRGTLRMQSSVGQIVFGPTGGLVATRNPNPPISITLVTQSTGTGNPKRCVIVETLLGATRVGSNNECT